MQNGGSKTAPYGSAVAVRLCAPAITPLRGGVVAVRLCTAPAMSLRDGHNARRGNLYMRFDVLYVSENAIFFVGRGLAPAAFFDLCKLFVNKTNIRFIPHNERTQPIQGGGSKPPPYG